MSLLMNPIIFVANVGQPRVGTLYPCGLNSFAKICAISFSHMPCPNTMCLSPVRKKSCMHVKGLFKRRLMRNLFFSNINLYVSEYCDSSYLFIHVSEYFLQQKIALRIIPVPHEITYQRLRELLSLLCVPAPRRAHLQHRSTSLVLQGYHVPSASSQSFDRK